MLLSQVRPLAALLGISVISSISLLVPTSALVSNPPESPQNLTQVICADRVDGRAECEVELDVPSACVSEGESSCPIVFFLHGAGGSNNGFSRRSGVHSAQVIGVYPNGERGWNTGPKSSNVCGWNDFDCTLDPDEGDYIASIIAEVRSQGAIGNIYVIGSSNGAALAHRLASNAGDDLPIKGIVATVTQLLASPERSGPGTLNYNQPSISAERKTPTVSVLSVMGTDDSVIPYEGGSSSVFGGDDAFQLMPALDSMTYWATHNGCTGANTPTTSTHTTDMGTGTATKYEYSGCPSGVFVEHYAIEGGGHNSGNGRIDGEKVKYVWAYEFISRVEAGGGGGGGGGPPVSSPVAAPSPINSCVDDPTWAGKVNTAHTCDYVAQNPDVRCNWENSEGVKANVACPEACDPDCTSSPVASPVAPPPTSSSPSSAPVASPVTSPTMPQDECTNDNTWAGKFNIDHTCDHVALKPDVRCNWENSEGVKANVACPEACDPDCTSSPISAPVAPPPTSSSPSSAPVASPVTSPTLPQNECINDDTWAGKFNVDHTCDHVALKPDVRCNWENSEGVKANVACPEACDPDCTSSPISAPVAPPPTSSSPSSAPVASPVTSPTLPQNECINDDTWAGKFNIDHTCDHVALKPDVRCNWENSEGVNANVACPLACWAECRASGSPCTDNIFCDSGECKADGHCH